MRTKPVVIAVLGIALAVFLACARFGGRGDIVSVIGPSEEYNNEVRLCL